MCGILGGISESGSFDKFRIKRSLQSLNHRGPDFSNAVYFHRAFIGHTRLATIDLSQESNQPLSCSEKRYFLIFNGEIYNYKVLRENLKKLGYSFRSEGDSEVVLNSYKAFGKNCLRHLEGCFSFAIYDREKNSFFLARDPFGIKPLYYMHVGDTFIFASELRAFLSFDISREIDLESVHRYFMFSYIPENNSIYKAIKKLAPGASLYFERGIKNIIHQSVSESNPSLYSGDYKNCKKKLQSLLLDSVEKHLNADVAVGCFLSGGIDSAILVGIASKLRKGLQTVSIGYLEDSFYDESRYSDLIARKNRTEHHRLLVSRNDLSESALDILKEIDEPFADSSAVAFNILSREARKYVKVCLSGDGSDELFAGYAKHYAEYMASSRGLRSSMIKVLAPMWAFLPKTKHSKSGNLIRRLDRYAQVAGKSSAERYWHWAKISDANLSEIMAPLDGFKDLPMLRMDNLKGHLDMDLQWVLPYDMLTKVDRYSMKNSLEVRVPFLNKQLLQFARSLPIEFLITTRKQKKILKDSFLDLLPRQVLNKNKKGFDIPLANLLKRELKFLLEADFMRKEFIVHQNLFDAHEISNLKTKLLSSYPGNSPMIMWNLIVFQSWYQNVHLKSVYA